MDEEEVFTRGATTHHWWEDCDSSGDLQDHREVKGGMVNSLSWAEELQAIFVPPSEVCYSPRRTRLSSISVSD